MSTDTNNIAIRAKRYLDHVSVVAAQSQFESIRQTRGSFLCEPMPPTREESDNGHLAINSSGRHHRNGQTLTVFTDIVCKAPLPDWAKSHEQLKVHAQFELTYELAGDFTDEFVECFSRVNGLYHAWPYMREFVQSVTTRMCIAALTLPVLQPTQAVLVSGILERQDLLFEESHEDSEAPMIE